MAKDYSKLDKALRPLGFSSKTKSFKVYYNQGPGLNAKVQRRVLGYLSSVGPIPEEKLKAVVLIIQNRYLNNNSEFTLTYSNEPKTVASYYYKIKESTITRWIKAVRVIDSIR